MVTFLKRRPLTSFLLGLGLLFAIIALGNMLSSLNKPTQEKKEIVKNVKVYNVKGSPTMTVQARVEKDGVINILAQTPGIVSSVNYTEGDTVQSGAALVSLSSNYQGGNAPALQAQLAQKQYDNASETFDTQKEIIAKQREAADKTETNAEALRKIANDSAGDTQALLDLNRDILNTIDIHIREAEANNDTAQVFGLRQQKSQVQSGVVQLQAQVRNLDLQKASDKTPAQLGVIQKDIAKKQLDVQEKALTLGLETSKIQRDLAWVQASLMSPAAPCKGVVERIHVKEGDSVNPGDPIATIKTDNNQATLEALVPNSLAMAVSQTSSSSAMVKGRKINLSSYYTSQEATSGQLYSILFNAPETITGELTDGEFITLDIPIGNSSQATSPYVPLDAIYQTENESYVFIVNGNKAASRKVSLGDVYGNFVVMKAGLRPNDKIILNRNVVAGETIRISQ